MKRFFILALCFLAAGCAAVSEENSSQAMAPVAADTSAMTWKFISVGQLHQGMSRNDVHALLGDKVVVGYELADPLSGQYKPLTMANPYRSETYQKKGREYFIEYYLWGIKQADNKISDDELIPLVFRNDQLVGMGWDFLKQNIKTE